MPPTVLLDAPRHAQEIRPHWMMFSCFQHSSRLMHHHLLSVFPSLSGRLVQEYNTERSEEVHHHARIHRKGAIDKEQRTPKRGASCCLESSDEPRPRKVPSPYVWSYIRDSADTIPRAVPRTLVPGISGVQLRHRSATFHGKSHGIKQDLSINTAYIVYPIRKPVNVTKNA